MLPEFRIAEENLVLNRVRMSAGGLAGVWANENTRDAIFDGLQNRETFATSGPRIKVRFFGGWDIDEGLLESDDWLAKSYKQAVPMGMDLKSGEGSPSFVIWAIKDPESANLDRIQLIKLYKDADGNPQESIFDIAWSDDRTPENGKLPAVGNTVDIASASYKNTIGSVELSTVWTDPTFDPTQDAAYYLRVLEIPTPRWSTHDAHKLEIEPPSAPPKVIQERAWSSPIWYNAK